MAQTAAEHRSAMHTFTRSRSCVAEDADEGVSRDVDEEPGVDVAAAAAVDAIASDHSSVGTSVSPHAHAELPNPKWH